MARRSSMTNRADSGISRELGSNFKSVKKVADNIDAVIAAAQADLEGLLDALIEATDFDGISVVSGENASWDPVNKVLTVPTVKGDAGKDLEISNIDDLGGGVFKWVFSDGSEYTTPSLKGSKGDKGDKGSKGDKGEATLLTSVVDMEDGTFIWHFSDSSSFRTPDLRGSRGRPGQKGDDGDPLTIVNIIDQGQHQFKVEFSDGTEYITPSLRGAKGDKGKRGMQGKPGLDGVSVHHLRPTTTTEPHGKYGEFGEKDTYTFYGDKHETIVLGHFVVMNGFQSVDEIEALGLMVRRVYDPSHSGSVVDSDRLGGKTLATLEDEVYTTINELGTVFTYNTIAEAEADKDHLTIDDEVFIEVTDRGGWVKYKVTAVYPDLLLEEITSESERDSVDVNTDLETTAQTLPTATNELKQKTDSLDNLKYDKTGGTITGDVVIEDGKKVTVTTVPTEDSDTVNKLYVDEELDKKFDKTGGQVSGDVSIGGKLTVQGGMAEVEAEHVSTSDTIIRLNDGEVGAGVANGFAGVEIDRGTEIEYEFGFNESTKLFEVGKVGNRQPLLTRMLTPVANKFFRWNAATKQAETADITWGDVTGKLSNVAAQVRGDIGLGTAATRDVGDGDGQVITNTAAGPGKYNISYSGTLLNNTTGSNNTASGVAALTANTTGYRNTANGAAALAANTTGDNNTANGYVALTANTTGSSNTASGYAALTANTTGHRNTANGYAALAANTTGSSNTASGYAALLNNTTGSNNTASGLNVLRRNTTGYRNTANGVAALTANTTGDNNTANGYAALTANTTGHRNTANGAAALNANIIGSNNTAIGVAALSSITKWHNCTGLGYNAQVTGSDQIQLGNSNTTAYTNGGALQNRSDIRDKAEIRDTVLGLDFINALRPVDYKLDMREDYRPELSENPTKEELEAQRLGNITADGTHTRKRCHHGLIAQEVAAVIETLGIDFGGFQDHKINGGDDVLSLGYSELISPLIKAVQEQQSMIVALTARLDALEGK